MSINVEIDSILSKDNQTKGFWVDALVGLWNFTLPTTMNFDILKNNWTNSERFQFVWLHNDNTIIGPNYDIAFRGTEADAISFNNKIQSHFYSTIGNTITIKRNAKLRRFIKDIIRLDSQLFYLGNTVSIENPNLEHIYLNNTFTVAQIASAIAYKNSLDVMENQGATIKFK